MSAARRDLVLVASGLELEGGGRAVVGRLLAAAGAAYARERGIGFSVLHLGAQHPFAENGFAIESLAGARLRLLLALGRRQLRRPPPAVLFDLLGPARAQVIWPAALRGPYGVFLHGIEVWRPLGGSRRRALAGAAVQLANSAYTLERARAESGEGIEHGEVLPLVLEERPPGGAVDEALVERAGAGYLLIVGRLDSGERYKGHDQLLEALPGVLRRCPGVRLVVAGGGDDRPRLEATACRLGLAGRVLFTGFVSEATLRQLYRHAAVFAMPSRGEGFGLVYLEAMREGIPCVAARGSAAGEIVVDGTTGRLVDPDDREELAAALAGLLADPEAARRLGEAGRRRLAERFTPEAFRRRLWRHLDRLTALPQSGGP